MKRILLIIIIFLIPFLGNTRTIEEIKRSGVMYVAFTESALNSINYKIAQEFAKFLNVKLVVVPITWDENFSQNGKIPVNYQTDPNIAYTPDALKKADFICGTMYLMPWREKFFDFAGIQEVSDLLIVPRDMRVKTYQDLKGMTIAFMENTSYQTNINLINNKIGGGILFKQTTSETGSRQALLDSVARAFITVSYLGLDFINKHKDFKLAFPVAKPQKVGWVVEKGNTGLKDEINNYFETIRGSGKLDQIFTTQFGVDYNTYLEIINSFSETLYSDSRDLDEILESGKLVVSLRDIEMIYHESGNKQFCHYLAEEFAKYLHVDLEIIITPTLTKYFENSKGVINKDSSYSPVWFNHFDVACELFEPTNWRLKKIDIIDFLPHAQVVIGRRETPLLTINDLNRYRGVVAKGSSNEEALIANNINNYYNVNTTDYLPEVSNRRADYTLGSIAVYTLPDYPQLEAKFIIGEISKVGWGIKKNQPKLRQKILEFFEYAKNIGILDTYFKLQTGMPFKAAENYLTALHQASQAGLFPFVFYGTNDGLSQENVLSIFQDKEGFMWFSNYSGAVKYNGRAMNPINLGKLNNNPVFDINQDANGVMYFATLKGIGIIENSKERNILENIPFKQIFIDKKNNKWFYGDKVIYLLNEKNTLENISKKIKGIPHRINAIAQDKKGFYTFFGSDKGLFQLDQDNFLAQFNDDFILTCFIDEDNRIWTSTPKGLFISEISGLEKGKIGERINDHLNIGNVQINKITQTKDGTIWLFSDYKIYQVFAIKQKPIIYDSNIGLNKHRITSFWADHEDNLWFGFAGGIQKLTNKSLRLFHPEILNSYVNSLAEDNNGRMWIGTNNNIYYFKEKLIDFTTSLPEGSKSFVVKKLDKNIVIATTKGLFEVDPNSLQIIRKNIFTHSLFHIDGLFISSKNEIFLLTGTEGEICYLKTFTDNPIRIKNSKTALVNQLIEFNEKIIGGNSTGIIEFKDDSFVELINLNKTVWSLCQDGNKLWVGTEEGIGIFKDNKFEKVEISLPSKVVKAIKPATNMEKLWIGTNLGFCYVDKKSLKIDFKIDSKEGLIGNEISVDGFFIDDKGLMWIATYHGLATFDVKKKKVERLAPEGRIERIWLNGQEVSDLNRILSHNENSFLFEITGLSFKDEQSVIYDFFMKGLDIDLSASVGNEYKANYQNLPPGKYEFVYRTKGKDGVWSYYKSIEFEIAKPFWLRWWFFLSVASVLVVLVWLIIKWRETALRKRNEHLEELVRLRTIELERQNEEIMAQRDEIEAQRDLAEQQRDEILRQKKDILDSIFYAKRIQTAILPPKKVIFQTLPQHFILFKPRDIVSGDFYWLKQKGPKTIVVSADCTGHGVPGAFMSMLGTAFLNEITSKEENIQANLILDQLREYVISSLHQSGRIDEAKDGMDIALVIINKQTLEMEFSGAFNPLFLIRKGQLTEYKADRMPIGIFDTYKPFTCKQVQLEIEDSIYIFSDGYHDQFGGPEGKKFNSNRFKQLLIEINPKPMYEQKEILDKNIEEWKAYTDPKGKNYDQVDDILVMGIKV